MFRLERPGRETLTEYHLRRALARTDWMIEARQRVDDRTVPVGYPRRATGAHEARREWRRAVQHVAGVAAPGRNLPNDTMRWIDHTVTHGAIVLTIRPAIVPRLPRWGQDVIRAFVDQHARATLEPTLAR